MTFTQVADGIKAVAAALIHLGIKPQDRVAILSENRPEWVSADLSSMLAGAITVPIHTSFSSRLAAEVLKSSGSRFIFVSGRDQLKKILSVMQELASLEKIISLDAERSPTLNEDRFLPWVDFLKLTDENAAFPATSPEDVCTLLYTSGTTGQPKGVMLTHQNFLSNAAAALQVIPFNETDTLLSFLPLSHVYERTGGYYAPLVIAGATIAYAKSLKELSENLLEIKPTAMLAMPRLFERVHDRIWQEFSRKGDIALRAFRWALERKPGTLSHFIADRLIFSKIRNKFGGRLRFAVSGGAALDPHLATFFRKVGLLICEGYGLTETSPVVAVNRPSRVKIGAVGQPIPGVKVKIAADGEILVRGPGVSKGYWQDEKATRELLDEDGWLHTGDLGRLDEEGFLSIVGRKKEMIVTAAGKNVWPEPLEMKLNASKYIQQSLVVGDNQKYLAALIVPDWTALKEFMSAQNRAADDPEILLRDSQVLALYRREIDHATADVAEYERIAKFALLAQEFSPEREEITPTLKLRRRVIADHYKKEIQAMHPARDLS